MKMWLYYLLWLAGGLFFTAGIFAGIDLIGQSRRESKHTLRRAATGLTITGFIIITLVIIGRTILSRRIPLSNMFEFGLIFLWLAIGVYLYTYFKQRLQSLGLVTLPLAALITLWLQTLDQGIKPLMPALKSPWLYFHVFTAIAAYGCFLISFAIAVLYLVKDRSTKSKQSISKLAANLPSLEVLDELTYKMIGFGMPFLTLCIITGAFWAEKAWGSYWSWDPKETWSLITWLIYAGFLHVRLIGNWRGKKAIFLAFAGFLAVIFTFLGVNLLLPGLHSYAS